MAAVNTRVLAATVVAAVVLTVAVVAGALALTEGTDSAAREPAPEAGTEASTSGTVTAARPDCPSDGVAGIKLDCLGGDPGDQPDDEGVTVVNVWAWWCGPCREELPHIQEFADANPDYTVVGVHADPVASRGADFLNDIGVALPSYQDDDNTFAGTLGLPRVIPVTVVFVDGELVESFPVPFTSTAEIDAAVDRALAGA